MTVRTVLIGLDGATFSVFDPLVKSGVMPFLGRFMASGVRGGLKTVVPALTPPAWTSMVTGRNPGEHGIFDFFLRTSVQSHSIRFATSQDVRGDTIWSLCDHYGLRSTVLNFPLTFPAPQVNGYVVPGWMPWRQLRLGCHPPHLYDRLRQLPGFNPRELAMDMALEEKALEGCREEEYDDWISLHIRREQHWCEIAGMLLEEDPTELVCVLFDGVDKMQHLFWRFIDPALAHTVKTEADRRAREGCLGYYRELDRLLESLISQVGEESTVIIASDHGFGAQVRTFYVNAWLAQRNQLSWTNSAGSVAEAGQTLGVGQIARHEYLLDWSKTQAYAPLPSGNGIHIVRQDASTPAGVPPAEYEAFREALIADLMELRDPVTGELVVSRVWRREEVFDGPYLELAPDLTLTLQDGGLISILPSPLPVVPRAQPSGTHRPEGVFMARGPALRAGVQLAQLSILDVAPLMMYSLGLPIDTGMQGHLPLEALIPERLRVQPMQIASLSVVTGTERPVRGPVVEMDESSREEMFRRLQALGYVE